jgi:hypothetical protein
MSGGGGSRNENGHGGAAAAAAAAAVVAAGGGGGGDAHEDDLVMPGFRFHPTEEELIEFYLRRKVEGKRFNVELITFLDLYRYDPWELPGPCLSLVSSQLSDVASLQLRHQLLARNSIFSPSSNLSLRSPT